MTEYTHAHHWMLVPFIESDVPATCKTCGATKVHHGKIDYQNSRRIYQDYDTKEDKVFWRVLRQFPHRSYYEAM